MDLQSTETLSRERFINPDIYTVSRHNPCPAMKIGPVQNRIFRSRPVVF